MSAALQGRARVGRAHSALARRSITRVRAAPSLPDPSSLPSLEEINAAASSLSSADATSSVTEAASALPPEVMYVGLGAAVLLAIGAAAVANKGDGSESDGTAQVKRKQLPRKNAVLVFGATGRTGRLIVQALLAAGRTVIAACRSSSAASKAWGEIGVQEGEQPSGGGVLFTETGVDITKAKTLSKAVFAGATQVAVAVGPVRSPDGKPGFQSGMSSERVDADGVSNVAAAATKQLPRASLVSDPVMQASDFASWQAKDDTVMGGTSSSKIEAGSGNVAKWSGELVVEGGGFCGVASPQMGLDLSEYDGLCLRVKGAGETFKVNIKTSDQVDEPVKAYQATFDTPAGDWTTVRLPWHEFVPVNMAKYNPEAGPLDPSKVSSLGLVYSRFDLNGVANPNHSPGPFSLEIEGGFTAYTAPRPSLVLVSSAGTERNAVIGDDAAARSSDIPIVQLNPAGTLNWKYKGETAVRASGLPYCVVRPTGLIQSDERPEDKEPYTVEFSQGDTISGRLSRADVATVVLAALKRPAAANTTFEARRTKRCAVGGPETFDDTAQSREFLKLSQDRLRRHIALPPMPEFVPPPPELSEAEKKALLASVQVSQASSQNKEIDNKVKAESGGAVGSEASAKLRKAAVNDWIEKWRAAAPDPPAAAKEAAGAVKETAEAAAAEARESAKAAQAWITKWRDAGPPAPIEAAKKAADSAVAAAADAASGPPSADDIATRKAEVNEWVVKWKDSSGGEASGEVRSWIAKWRESQTVKA